MAFFEIHQEPTIADHLRIRLAPCDRGDRPERGALNVQFWASAERTADIHTVFRMPAGRGVAFCDGERVEDSGYAYHVISFRGRLGPNRRRFEHTLAVGPEGGSPREPVTEEAIVLASLTPLQLGDLSDVEQTVRLNASSGGGKHGPIFLDGGLVRVDDKRFRTPFRPAFFFYS